MKRVVLRLKILTCDNRDCYTFATYLIKLTKTLNIYVEIKIYAEIPKPLSYQRTGMTFHCTFSMDNTTDVRWVYKKATDKGYTGIPNRKIHQTVDRKANTVTSTLNVVSLLVFIYQNKYDCIIRL